MTNDSPYIQTFLIGFFVWIGSKIGSATLGVALYLLLQMLYMSLVAAYAIDIMKKNGVDSKVCRIITIIYAINPIYPLYAVSVGKDINFGATVLLLSVIIFELVRTKGIWLIESKSMFYYYLYL